MDLSVVVSLLTSPVAIPCTKVTPGIRSNQPIFFFPSSSSSRKRTRAYV